MRLVLAISLLLNLMLGLRVLTRQGLENDSAPPHSISLNVRTGNLSSAHRVAAPRKEPSAEAPTDGNSTLDWRTIESADYPVYVARLRSANVPEDLVRELVIADVRKAFSPRAHAILGTNEHTRYWQKPQYEPRSSEQLQQLRDLEKEEQGVLAQVLGIQTTIQALVDRLYLQIDPREVALGGFPSEVQEAAKRALENAGIRHDEVDPSLAEGAEDPADLNRIQRRRVFSVAKT